MGNHKIRCGIHNFREWCLRLCIWNIRLGWKLLQNVWHDDDAALCCIVLRFSDRQNMVYGYTVEEARIECVHLSSATCTNTDQSQVRNKIVNNLLFCASFVLIYLHEWIWQGQQRSLYLILIFYCVLDVFIMLITDWALLKIYQAFHFKPHQSVFVIFKSKLLLIF